MNRLQFRTLRRLIAKAGRDKAILRTLPNDLGGARYSASVEGGLKHLRLDSRDVDPVLAAFARRYVFSGSHVWDVGANLGLFTWMAAGLSGPQGLVLAIEPDPWLVSQILIARDANRPKELANVRVLSAAAGNAYDVAALHIAQSSRATNFVDGYGSTMTGGTRYTVDVATIPLDALLQRYAPPQVLKIDVEGAEQDVIAGLADTIESHRPTILLEIRSHFTSVYDILRGYGYHLFDAQASDLSSDRLAAAGDKVAYNTLALPRERIPAK